MDEQKAKRHHHAIDMLRIVSIIAVVAIHTTTKTLSASGYDLHRIPWTLFMNQSFRFAVPLFFMISGFVLELNYNFHQSYFSYVKKRINRIIIPYIFWSLIYYFIVYGKKYDFFNVLWQGNASYQLYFIPTLLIFYLLFPLVHKHAQFVTKRFIVVLLAILQITFLSYDYYIAPLKFANPINIALLNFFIFYVGFLIARNRERVFTFIKHHTIALLLITCFMMVFITVEAEHFYFKTNNYLSFYSQWRPSILIYTIVISGVLYTLFDKPFWQKPFFKTLSRLSFFVFFIHVAILEILWQNIGQLIFQQSQLHIIAEQAWYDPLCVILVSIISFTIAYVVHKIPLLAKVTG